MERLRNLQKHQEVNLEICELGEVAYFRSLKAIPVGSELLVPSFVEDGGRKRDVTVMLSSEHLAVTCSSSLSLIWVFPNLEVQNGTELHR